MLQILYLIAFAIVAVLAVRSLISSLISIGAEQRKPIRRRPRNVPHPELVDEQGNPIDEPLLVIRPTTLEDARSRLDELYHESPDDDR